jgi:transcriptional regulator with XRE-family HTH domain
MAENLWELREQKRISVATMANRAGLPIGLIMEYESGQRSIDPRHLTRLARALYVEEEEIRLQSEPRPGAPPLERHHEPERRVDHPADRPAQPPPPKPRERPPRPVQAQPPPSLPPRPSQLAHLEVLLKRLERTQAALESELGKPIASLDRVALSTVLKLLQDQAKEKVPATRHRAYLPESVDEFEARYLGAAQASGEPLRFSLFDGTAVEGAVLGFGPYIVTLRLEDGSELTLNKLALVSYRRLPAQAMEPKS